MLWSQIITTQRLFYQIKQTYYLIHIFYIKHIHCVDLCFLKTTLSSVPVSDVKLAPETEGETSVLQFSHS